MIEENAVNQYAARQLLALRQTMGISQKRLGEEVGLSPQQVQKYERGTNRLSVGKAMQFAEAFEVSILVLYPKQGECYPDEPLPPSTVRFIRLLARIPVKHYDKVYEALKAIVQLAGDDDAD